METSTNQDQLKKEKKKPYIDWDGNEIGLFGKRMACFTLIVLILGSIFFIIALWPDQLPDPKEKVKPLYTKQLCNIRLVYIPTDSANLRYTAISSNARVLPPENMLIHLNTLLLILVAIGGFLGNLLHVATSFTTFVGEGKFRMSWGPWYVIKPFTASALSLAIYFVFRGGFLSMSSDTANINLYGVMTLSILAGLFTDRATLKLKEVFDVLFKPKEDRADALTDEPKVTKVSTDPLEVGKPITITLTGANLAKKKLTIKIEDAVIDNADIKADTITFTYTLPLTLKDKTAVMLQVLAENGEEIFKEMLPVKPST